MSPSWPSQPLESPPPGQEYEGKVYKPKSRSWCSPRTKRFWLLVVAAFLGLAIALGVGLGIGLTRGGSSGEGSGSNEPAPPISNSTNATTGNFWQPQAGASWQIVLLYPLNDTTPNVDVYDIDLFTNPASTIASLHAQNRSVICYFSAGSYEDFRPDSSDFLPSDYAKPLEGWPGEWWLNTNSSNVRKIMSARLALAASKGCDGVDPDNVDGFDNDTGLDLTTADAVNYLTFLAVGAHSLNMSLGLKNAGSIVNQTLDMMQWEVNESCEEYDECDLFQPFIEAGKPVFHIEYPESAPNISAATQASVCNFESTTGFSTILKNLDLDNFLDAC